MLLLLNSGSGRELNGAAIVSRSINSSSSVLALLLPPPPNKSGLGGVTTSSELSESIDEQEYSGWPWLRLGYGCVGGDSRGRPLSSSSAVVVMVVVVVVIIVLALAAVSSMSCFIMSMMSLLSESAADGEGEMKMSGGHRMAPVAAV